MIIEVRGERALVQLPRQSGCAACGRCVMTAGGKLMLLEVLNAAGASPGDTVEVDIPARDTLEASLLLFGLPLAGFFIGLAAGYGLAFLAGWDGTSTALGAGILFLIVTFHLIRRMENRRGKKEGEPRIVRVIAGEGT